MKLLQREKFKKWLRKQIVTVSIPLNMIYWTSMVRYLYPSDRFSVNKLQAYSVLLYLVQFVGSILCNPVKFIPTYQQTTK